jgi:hypothetical protein
MDKDDEPKPVADYWINPAFKKSQPGPGGIFISTGVALSMSTQAG